MKSLAPVPVVPRGTQITDTDRAEFWARVDHQDSIRPCWEWRGLISEGRPRHELRGHRVLAHRAAYLLAYGVDPGALIVLHSCDNELCVNPRHLRLGTAEDNGRDRSVAVGLLRMFALRQAVVSSAADDERRRQESVENIRRLTRAGLAPGAFIWSGDTRAHRPNRGVRRDTGERSSRSTRTDADAASIRTRFWGGTERVSEIANALGIRRYHVENIVRRKCFAHLPLVAGEPPFEQLGDAIISRTKLARAARMTERAGTGRRRANGRDALPLIRDGEVVRDGDGNVVTLGQIERDRRRMGQIAGAAA